ncbi:porphobilinogen deaminase, dipyromethane cofactor binding domain protein, partial [Chlamydia psittaci 03DC29]
QPQVRKLSSARM